MIFIKQALLSLIGPYVNGAMPIYNDDMEIVFYIWQPDWAWILSAVLCIVLVYCFCKAVGGMLCRM